jgi:hypothetical protein
MEFVFHFGVQWIKHGRVNDDGYTATLLQCVEPTVTVADLLAALESIDNQAAFQCLRDVYPGMIHD